jgi:hypothetical protein
VTQGSESWAVGNSVVVDGIWLRESISPRESRAVNIISNYLGASATRLIPNNSSELALGCRIWREIPRHVLPTITQRRLCLRYLNTATCLLRLRTEWRAES